MTKMIRRFLLTLSVFCLIAGYASAQTCTTLEAYGGSHDGATNNTPALTAALAANVTCLTLGPGYYMFSTPTPAITHELHLTGSGVSSTAIIKGWASTAGDIRDALLNFESVNANGSSAEHMSIVSNAPGTHGTLLRLHSMYGSPVSYTRFSDLNFTYSTGSDYDLAIYVDGNDASTAAQGVRTPKLDGISVFQPLSGYVVRVENAVGLMMSNFWTNGAIYIGGLGWPSQETVTAMLSNVNAGLQFFIEQSAGVVITGGQTTTLTVQSTAINGGYMGLAINVFNASTSFRVY
jgi:hypothetical protein